MSAAMSQYNIHEAKTHFSKIVERVQQGEEIVLSRAGEPFAKIVPLPAKTRRTSYGSLRDQIQLAEDWDSDQTNELIARQFGMVE